MGRNAGLAIAWAIFAVAMLALIAMPASSYDWMTQMDPMVAPGSIEEGDNRWPMIALVALIAALGAQLAVLKLAVSRPMRATAVALMIVAAVVWAVRFVA
ncbi:hypothetical protein D1610_07575 [Sphingomonas gilva]|uniref:Uncharacterized protein n=1 Tax=Sphingomonas gilva TaxID=2305907 RepID=A0A396RP57_9SPHN|nr:hypothetical protein [Sphingomonas gilva]RHW18317.1 hypothetical protein D1610_07575 [Sphingomonas gilva]